MFDTVLIAIDDDTHARSAVQIGGRLARDLKGRVIVFHVVPPAPTYATQAGFHLPAGELRKAATEHGKEVLQEAAQHLPDDARFDRREGVASRDGPRAAGALSRAACVTAYPRTQLRRSVHRRRST